MGVVYELMTQFRWSLHVQTQYRTWKRTLSKITEMGVLNTVAYIWFLVETFWIALISPQNFRQGLLQHLECQFSFLRLVYGSELLISFV